VEGHLGARLAAGAGDVFVDPRVVEDVAEGDADGSRGRRGGEVGTSVRFAVEEDDCPGTSCWPFTKTSPVGEALRISSRVRNTCALPAASPELAGALHAEADLDAVAKDLDEIG
jgi:hypothetical protein